MKLTALLMVRNEAHEVGLALRVLLKFCDEVVCLIHASTDATEQIVAEIRQATGRVTVFSWDDSEWHEMKLRQWMLDVAREGGATHIWMADADEVLASNLANSVRAHVENLRDGEVLYLPLYNLRNGISTYHANGVWGNRIVSVAFKDAPGLGWFGDRFHQREPGALRMVRPVGHGSGGVMHLWGANERRLIAKHHLYRCVERLRWPQKSVEEIERMYSLATNGDPLIEAYGTPETWTYAPVPAEWWAGYSDLLQYLDVDALPWQEQQVAEIIANHGREHFTGLDLG